MDIRKIGLTLARPSTLFYTLIWLMIVLIAGTVAQKYVGLYRAQNIFFFSPILWLGPVPLPGGLTTISFLSLSLLAKLVLTSRWAWSNSGIIITHLGALLLLGGGLLTFVQSQEGSMVLFPGDKASTFRDYHERNLVVEDKATGKPVLTVPWAQLQEGKTVSVPNLPLKIEILKICRNCDIFARKTPDSDPIVKELQGRAKDFDIAPAPLAKEDEENRSAMQFRVSGADADKNGIHFSADFIPVSPWVSAAGKDWNIALRRKTTDLPFEVELVHFEKILHPGTEIAKSYKSEVILRDKTSEWRGLIQMNEPLRYRGYTFYQASYIDDGDKAGSVLAVVKNAGRMFPYISSIVMCIGLLLHMILRLPALIARKAVLAPLLLALTASLLTASPARAAALDTEDFARIPVLDQGRVKPLDTFARSWLETLSGRDSLNGMSAIDWLAELIANPDKAYSREIFYIPNPDVVTTLELERRPGHRYAYREVTTAFYIHVNSWSHLYQVPEDQLTMGQKQLLELFGRVQSFAEISRSLSLLFPEFVIPEGPVAKALDVPAGERLSYLDLRSRRAAIEALIAKDKNAPGLKDLVLRIQTVERDAGSQAFRVIPPQWSQGENAVWYSPWTVAQAGEGSPETVKLLKAWADVVVSYRDGDAAKWKTSTAALRDAAKSMAGDVAHERTLALETAFNKAKPFTLSFGLYLAAFLSILGSFVVRPKEMRLLAFTLLFAGIAFHGAGLGARMIIMERPPVTNLYGSIIFVGLVAGAIGAAMELRLKNRLGILIGAATGAFLQLVGIQFDAEGDTMGMLVAVLDTNFWLGTHVVMITIGYGFCLVGSLLGHIYLAQRIAQPAAADTAAMLARNMRGVALIALFFAALGTILGGIWADQSWGRFWGWDPKENGALLIVLWLLFLLHGKLAGKLDELGYATAMTLTSVIVAMAWFGVNLLGVGLHSYGFTQSAMTSFVVFCVVETLLALGAYLLIRLRPSATGA